MYTHVATPLSQPTLAKYIYTTRAHYNMILVRYTIAIVWIVLRVNTSFDVNELS